ncbi:hypothetical protein, partial [Azovibrio restrictus]|uniref:hypothetical protein n=1 Tax=Azovibrio restrictus TaxID=146938 RepID=UPI0026EAA9F9
SKPLNNQKITSKHPRKSTNLLINHFFPEPLSGNELRILQHLKPMSTAICGFFGEKIQKNHKP